MLGLRSPRPCSMLFDSSALNKTRSSITLFYVLTPTPHKTLSREWPPCLCSFSSVSEDHIVSRSKKRGRLRMVYMVGCAAILIPRTPRSTQRDLRWFYTTFCLAAVYDQKLARRSSCECLHGLLWKKESDFRGCLKLRVVAERGVRVG